MPRGIVVAEQTSRDSRIFGALDSGYTSILSLVARAPRHHRGHRRAGAAQQRAAVHGRQQELPAQRRPGRVRGRRARARRHEPRGHRDHRQPDREPDSAPAGRELHARLGGRRSGADAELRDHLRPADAGQRARPGPVRADERGAERDSAGGRRAEPAHRRPAGRDDRRRRQPERRNPVHHQRARSEAARAVREYGHGGSEEGARRRRPRHVAQRRQARALGASSTGSRPPIWACRFPMRPTRCGCSSAAIRSRPTTRAGSSTRSTSAPSKAIGKQRRRSAS